MKISDKLLHLQQGEGYTRQFLVDCLTEQGEYYPPVDKIESYTCFCKKEYRSSWEPELLSEQDYRCCYCMQRIEHGKISVEHIIPESFDGLDDEEEYSFYVQHSSILKNHVELAKVFAKRAISTETIINTGKLPHIVAYANLLAACKGVGGFCEEGCCCNNYRGNLRILPLPLMQNVEDFVEYDEDGTISIKYTLDKEMSAKTISNLHLNDSTLKEIRSIWYRASKLAYSFEEIASFNPMARRNFFCQIFQCKDLTTISENYQKYINPGNDTYWTVFLRYDWFLGYYRRKN